MRRDLDLGGGGDVNRERAEREYRSMKMGVQRLKREKEAEVRRSKRRWWDRVDKGVCEGEVVDADMGPGVQGEDVMSQAFVNEAVAKDSRKSMRE